jgi:uncharacterized protein with von Willebrand factor type A (vWA) domain
MIDEAIKPGSLSTHLVAFCRFLRSNGFTIGPQEELEMFTVLVKHPFEEVEIFKLTLTQLLCKSRQQQLDFPGLFDQFWQELFKSFGAKIKPVSERASTRNPVRPATTFELKKWLYNQQPSETHETAFYSRGMGNGLKLSDYQEQGIQELIRRINQLAKKWATRPGRRKVKSKSAGQLDLRQMIRQNMSIGEMINIRFRENKRHKPRLVLVCDVSKSMDLFSNFTVQLLYAFQNNYRSIETFVFGSELYRVSKLLKYHSFNHALELLSEQVPDWSGGTRIGHSLHTLIREYDSRLLHGNVILMIISDGWDTGEIGLLTESLAHIKRRVKKLIWFNPHASKPGFKAEVKGMVAAMPYVDLLSI